MKDLIFLLGLLMVLSCDNEYIPITSEDQLLLDTTSIDNLIIWQIPLSEDSTACFSFDTKLIENGVLYSCNLAGQVKNELVKLANKEDGSPIWEWNGYIRPARGQRANIAFSENGVIAINSSQDNYGINAENGKTIWATDHEYGDPIMSIFSNMLFHNPILWQCST